MNAKVTKRKVGIHYSFRGLRKNIISKKKDMAIAGVNQIILLVADAGIGEA